MRMNMKKPKSPYQAIKSKMLLGEPLLEEAGEPDEAEKKAKPKQAMGFPPKKGK